MTDASPPLADSTLSVNSLVRPRVERLLAEADALGLLVSRDPTGACIVDAGIQARSSIAAGLLIGEICMGGLGHVGLRSGDSGGVVGSSGSGSSGSGGGGGGLAAGWPTWLEVRSSQPVLACLASQYAGWSLSATKEETGGKKFFSLGSGPARALAGREALFTELGYRDRADTGVLVLEVDRPPPPIVVAKLLRDCGLQPEALTLILTPTVSLAGTTQVVARVLEVALHKAHSIGYPLGRIVEGVASAPLPAPSADGVVAMGRTNDAILYGGRVHLSVRGDDAAARQLALQLPSRNSRDYGRSFADIFKEVEYDFYRIDGALFAPAEVWVSNLDSGNTWHAGALNMELLLNAWLQAA